MAGPGNAAPVIIKRRKSVQEGGHHGGAWKVAYADFVTAMMAFFLLMWLLNATTDKQRKGIADYFNPVMPIHRTSGGGDGMFEGDSLFSEDSRAREGSGAAARHPSEQRRAMGLEADTGGEQKVLKDLMARLDGLGGESPERLALMRHIVTRLTDEGLVVELFDLTDRPLFDGESERPTQILRDLIPVVAGAFALVENAVAVHGHVRSLPITRIENPVWQQSSSRAHQARQLMELSGFAPARMRRVSGIADRRPAVADPMVARNNRIEFVLLRNGT